MFSKIVDSLRGKSSPVKDTNKSGGSNDKSNKLNLPERLVYGRPNFLCLSEEDEKTIGDHELRTIVAVKDDSLPKLPCCAGYAECINGGKSLRNEDQATAGKFVLPSHSNKVISQEGSIEVRYFCIFDGHAGTGASLMAADQLVNHLQEKLMGVVEHILSLSSDMTGRDFDYDQNSFYDVTVDSLVTGAIEAAFVSFDEQIATESKSFYIPGGCTAIMALVLLDRLYVAHAGDSRAVGYIGDETIELSQEFTPESDAGRIQALARVNPSLTHGIFTENCFHRALGRKDLGTKLLYRPPLSSGWFSKTITQEDIDLPPLVVGRGKWARLMGVIGVTRGFGDHDLTVQGTDFHVKDFMTPMPEIRVFNLAGRTFDEEDVLVMGCDGLWDFVSNEDVKTVLKASLNRVREQNDTGGISYNAVAKDIVNFSRGDNNGRGWKMTNGRDASFDDISAFIIPFIHLRSSEKAANKQSPTNV